jgi:Na(+)-translocating NADH:ubiquinone oxidoreductase F subunit
MSVTYRDYALTQDNKLQAMEKGLSSANWYTTPIPREKMRELLTRRDGPAIRDTLIWFGLMIVSGIAGFQMWGSWWAVIPFLIYGVVYGSSSDSRWHETSHGTAFKTDWMNNALYEIASFMVLRNATVWRWSHARHHSDTIIVGTDPEIAVPRPPNTTKMFLNMTGIFTVPQSFRTMLRHAGGTLTEAEQSFIPENDQRKVYVRAQIYLCIYGLTVALSIYAASILPLMYIVLPAFYGSFMMAVYGTTQHAALAEDVLDHRLNCRTVYMNLINRYLYWNMNYHVEHHMFPLVPYHALPRLHELMKHDCPPAYTSIFDAYKEIIPALRRQEKDPTWFVQRPLPESSGKVDSVHAVKTVISHNEFSKEGWVKICSGDKLDKEDVLRFDHESKTYAVYRTAEGAVYATDGICTHGNTHLAEGIVMGKQIECPKHNGRFDITDGSPKRDPVCVPLKAYAVHEQEASLYLDLTHVNKGEDLRPQRAHTFEVVSNKNVASFIKELTLEPLNGQDKFKFSPGEFIQLEIPPYELHFSDLAIEEPYAKIWRDEALFECHAENTLSLRRNYSMASNPETDYQLRFNVRIATPPPGQAHSAGVGSSYVFNLKPGDHVEATGPFGDFHIKDTQREMVYIGGGAGMAPLRSHLSSLFETLKTNRKVSYWYGARSPQEVFYAEYFDRLAEDFNNFSFHLAFSDQGEDETGGFHKGFIHDVVRSEYLSAHPDPASVEYYLCGPPAMIEATQAMLEGLGVDPEQIAYDAF